MRTYRYKDLTGLTFGKWTVLKESDQRRPSSNHRCWEVTCECGESSIVCGADLKRGRTTQCIECAKISAGNKRSTHGATKGGNKHPIYKAWGAMKGRVISDDPSYFPYYKGKGITVCEEWRQSFEAFRDWSLANGWKKGYSLDRKDPNGNYEPSNCRWATATEQQRNRTNNKFIEAAPGLTLSFQDAIDYFGNVVHPETARMRIKGGWTELDAVSKPTIKRKE